MSLITVLAFLLLGSSITYAALDPKEFSENLQRIARIIHDQCDLIVGITQKEIDDMRNGTFPDNERIQRYVLCTYIVSNVIYYDDNINFDTVALDRNIPKEIMTNGTQMFVNCMEETKKAGVKIPHVIVWEMTKCIYEGDPEHFIMF